MRRLQLAAEAGNSIGFIYRPPAAAMESSPAAVRLRLQTDTDGQLNIDVVKCRGARAGELQNVESVVHVVATEVEDYTPTG